MNRIEPLDWLRGFLACSIMIYHYMFWTVGSVEYSSALGKLGIYGVSAFFILSGLSLAIVYHSAMNRPEDIISYIMKRFFRIIPLMGLVTTYVIVSDKVTDFSFVKIITNYTATFGFIDPTGYMMTGGWSIGNEMVYYLFFPLFIYFYHKSTTLGNMVTLLTVIVEILYLTFSLSSGNSLADQWPEYINPFNNLFFFAIGIAIFFNYATIKIKTSYLYLIIVISILVFCFYPISGDAINLVTGVNRLILSMICVVVVLALYKLTIQIKKHFSSNLLNHLGIISYSVYLIHPIMYFEVKKLLHAFSIDNLLVVFLASVVFTLIMSSIIYKYYENPLIRAGKILTIKLFQNQSIKGISK